MIGGALTVDAVERAVALACRRSHAEVVAFTVAPRDLVSEMGDGHDWLVEFGAGPRCPMEVFRQALDAFDTGASRVIELPAGTFERWARAQRASGEPDGVPRVTTDRWLAESLRDAARQRCLVTTAPAAGTRTLADV